MKEGRRIMQAILTKAKKEEADRKPLTPVESYSLKVVASRRMSVHIDRSLGRSYAAVLKAMKGQVYGGGRKK